MVQLQLTIINPIGLHARPAAELVETATKYQCVIRARNLTRPGEWVNVKSILGVLLLGAEQNHCVELLFDGKDEAEAAQQIEYLISSGFEADSTAPVMR